MVSISVIAVEFLIMPGSFENGDFSCHLVFSIA